MAVQAYVKSTNKQDKGKAAEVEEQALTQLSSTKMSLDIQRAIL